MLPSRHGNWACYSKYGPQPYLHVRPYQPYGHSGTQCHHNARLCRKPTTKPGNERTRCVACLSQTTYATNIPHLVSSIYGSSPYGSKQQWSMAAYGDSYILGYNYHYDIYTHIYTYCLLENPAKTCIRET